MRKRLPRRKRALSATSPKTGITHVFSDAAATERMIRDFQSAKATREANDLLAGITFQKWLGTQTLPSAPTINQTAPLYRLVYNGFSPTSIAGSLADGGRFNVGGAQLHPLFSGVQKFGALYLASSIACCYAEAAPPYGNPAEYELTPTRPLAIWDLTAVIAALPFPQLDDQVKAAPTDALWSFQKSPLVSQLLAARLKAIGGDGVVFPSTKMPSESNFAIFSRDDTESAGKFSVRRTK